MELHFLEQGMLEAFFSFVCIVDADVCMGHYAYRSLNGVNTVPYLIVFR